MAETASTAPERQWQCSCEGCRANREEEARQAVIRAHAAARSAQLRLPLFPLPHCADQAPSFSN